MVEIKITAIDISPRMIAEALSKLDSDGICEFIRDMLDQGDLFDPDLRRWLIEGLQGDLESQSYMREFKTKNNWIN